MSRSAAPSWTALRSEKKEVMREAQEAGVDAEWSRAYSNFFGDLNQEQMTYQRLAQVLNAFARRTLETIAASSVISAQIPEPVLPLVVVREEPEVEEVLVVGGGGGGGGAEAMEAQRMEFERQLEMARAEGRAAVEEERNVSRRLGEEMQGVRAEWTEIKEWEEQLFLDFTREQEANKRLERKIDVLEAETEASASELRRMAKENKQLKERLRALKDTEKAILALAEEDEESDARKKARGKK